VDTKINLRKPIYLIGTTSHQLTVCKLDRYYFITFDKLSKVYAKIQG
jgi:hypothetical protein